MIPGKVFPINYENIDPTSIPYTIGFLKIVVAAFKEKKVRN
jgi:hypothetical protein